MTIERIKLFMHDDAAANGGVGTVGWWNFGGEEASWGSAYMLGCNVCMVLTSRNDGTQPGAFSYSSYQGTLSTAHSLGATTFFGQVSLISQGRRNAPLILQGPTDITFHNLYISDTGGAGSNKSAIHIMDGNVVAMRGKVLIESLSHIKCTGGLINCDLDVQWGGVDDTADAAIRVDRTKANGWIHTDVKINLEAATSRAILSTVDADEATASSYYINNSSIKARAGGVANLYMPANVGANASTRNVALFGATNSPSESTFSVGLTSSLTNSTGDGTTVSLNASAVTSAFDRAACVVAGTGIFTAKLTGDYDFSAQVSLANLGAAHTDAILLINANGQDYQLARINSANARNGSNECTLSGTARVPLTAGQTAYVKVQVSGSTKTVTIESGASGNNWRTRFSGRLIF
jgi:hypothetical protein